MKFLILLLISFSSNAYYWDINCQDEDITVKIKVNKVSQTTTEHRNYDVQTPMAEASVSVASPQGYFEYKQNIVILDEENGNFQLTIFSTITGQFETISNLYYEDEGKYLSGHVSIPVYENGSVIGFRELFDSSEAKCND